MKTWCIGVALLTIVVSAGCGKQPAPPVEPSATVAEAPAQWLRLDATELNPEQVILKEKAVAAKDDLGTQLMGELVQALDNRGAYGAIEVCRDLAPSISAYVGQQHGLAIGRTSFRLRSPANAPPAWAEPAVAEQVAEPAFFGGPAGELGVLLPIRVKAECAMCHGRR